VDFLLVYIELFHTDICRETDLSKWSVDLCGSIAVSNSLVKTNRSDGLRLLKGRERNVHCTVNKHE